MEQRKTHLIFTYGTLKQGFYNHYHLETSQCLGKAFIQKNTEYLKNRNNQNNEYFQIVIDNHWFIPYLFEVSKLNSKGQNIQIENIQPIQGELYLVDDETLVKLDKLEDVPDRYKRENLDVYLESNNELENALKQSGNQYEVQGQNIVLKAGVYVCNIDLDQRMGGFSEIFKSDYSQEDHVKYVPPKDRKQNN